ncbi:MAG: outer membrane protein assembly factor BamB [Candidatus Porifericomitaceae bacterium WSBS_2022_MAG_OTU9]
MRLIALFLITLAATSCGLIEKKTVKLPPLPLFNTEIDIDKLWSKGFDADKHNLYPGLRPAIADSIVYVASPEGKVAAIEVASGKSLWQYSHGETSLSGGPGANNGLAVVGDHDGMVHAHGADGTLLWSTQLSSEILAAPAVGYNQVVVRASDGQLFGLSAKNGQNLWALNTTVPVLTLRGGSAPVISSNSVITGFDNGNLTMVDLDSGRLLWEEAFGAPGGSTELERIADIDRSPLVVGNNIWVASYQSKVSMINIITGRVVWSYLISTNNDLAADDDTLYVVDEDGILTALELDSGKLRWTQEALRNQRLSGVAVVGANIACGDSKGNVHWFARNDGRIVGRNKLSGAITSAPLGFDDRTIVVYTNSGTLAALQYEPLVKP